MTGNQDQSENGEACRMDWKTLLAYISVSVDRQFLFRNELRATFGRWYPGMQRGVHQEQEAA
jgi:hypothetical protein